MRQIFLIIAFLTGLSFVHITSAQTISPPKWILGTWHNSAESNTNNWIFLTFTNDSIFINNGSSQFDRTKQECFNKKYKSYTISNEYARNTYRIIISKEAELISYEFKLRKVYYENKPVLTYSYIINGTKIRDHSTSCNLILTK